MFEGYCKLYASEIKIKRTVERESSVELLQRYKDSLKKLTKEWQMKLNSIKYKVMHFCKKKHRSEYSIKNLTTEQRKKLDETYFERDMVVFVSTNLI